MKKFLVLILLTLSYCALGNMSTYQKLTEVNKCWVEQKDISIEKLNNLNASSEKEWIQLHLSLVEQTLRSRKSTELNSSQQNNRAYCLDLLHRYWQEANFPINDEYSYLTPIFIDKYDNFCAVGFLIKETDNEAISRMIASKTNLAYVREMNYRELGIWAKENGFTIDELAWIQPGYPPESRCGKIGNGVDGFVQELFVDTTTQQLFVGGKFIQADKAFVANNIAYVTENAGVYTWHKMSNGVNGQVNAITKFDGKIFVAGSFDSASGIEAKNIAFWDGITWNSAGCIDGVVNDLLVFEGTLYAAGFFKSCGTDIGKNFAQWNGSKWTTITGIEGKINTLEAAVDHILLGGKFSYDTALNVNAIKWNSTTHFQKFPNKVYNEVMDFEFYQDTLHVACKRTITTDTLNLFLKLKSDKWVSFYSGTYYKGFFSSTDSFSFNTLCSDKTAIYLGGSFRFYPFIGTGATNCIGYGGYWIDVHGTVQKMVFFKSDLIVAGKFKTGMAYEPYGGSSVELNGITKRLPWKLGIDNYTNETTKALKVYPNPVASGKIIIIDNLFSATEYSINALNGKQCSHGKVSNKNEIQIPQLPVGTYLLSLQNANGQKMMEKIIVE